MLRPLDREGAPAHVQPTRPTWFNDRELCAYRGAHMSRLISIASHDGTFAPVAIQVRQRLIPEAVPHISVRSEAGEIILGIDQARAVAFKVSRIARMAGGVA